MCLRRVSYIEPLNMFHRSLTDLDTGLAILEFAERDLARRVTEPGADFIDKSGVRSAREDTRLTHLEGCLV